MRKFFIGVFILATLTAFLFIFKHAVHAEAYPCQTYSGSNKCIDLSISSGCNGTSPTVTWSWTKKFNNTTFTIVYSRNGSWYIKTLGNVTSYTMTNPPFGGPGSGGTDNTPLKANEYIGGKISGGTAPYITTGYTNPDVSTTVKNCAVPTATPTPTPTPTVVPTHSPTPTPIIATTGDVTIHLEGVDQDNFQNDESIIPTKESQGSSKARTLTLYFYPSTAHPETDNPMFVKSDTVTQITDSKSDFFGNFRQHNFKLTGITNGTYTILAKIQEGSLIEYVSGSQTPIQIYNQGGNNELVNVDSVDLSSYKLTYQPPTVPPTMHMGDIMTRCLDTATCDFNTVTPFDYNALVDCYGTKITNATCKVHNYPGDQNNMFNGKQYFVADLNGDGVVDGIDYTMLLKNYNITGVNVNLASAKIKASVPVQPTPLPTIAPTPTQGHTPTPTPTGQPTITPAPTSHITPSPTP